jgi:hypothetical protein
MFRREGLEPDVFQVDVDELRRARDSVRVEELQTFDDITRAGDIETVLSGQTLDRCEGEDVALRIATPVRRGSSRNAKSHALVHHQRARVG